MKLKRLKQCAKCPWKISTNPHDIPHGYDTRLHRGLAETIAHPGALPRPGAPLRIMACHEHAPGQEAHCVGWLMNQLGAGNNIALRLAMLDCENLEDVVLDGPQHGCLEETLPEE